MIRCEVKNCKNEAKFFMYRINENLSKDWIKVCVECERKIGDENMRLQGYNPVTSLPINKEARAK